MWKNPLNLAILEWLNQFSQLSPKFNYILSYIERAYTFKGLATMSMLWYLWFLPDSSSIPKIKATILGTVLACILALFITSAINYITPFQPTPLANEALRFQVPIASTIDKASNTGRGWINSFPSHHATMFYAIATGIFLAFRRLGYFAFFYVTLFIMIPRLYLGLHYPTDVIAGAVVGMLTTKLVNKTLTQPAYEKLILSSLQNYPAFFQTALFAVTFEIAVLFADAIGFVGLVIKHLLK